MEIFVFPEALIDDINLDIQQANSSMEEEKFKNFSENAFFKDSTSNSPRL